MKITFDPKKNADNIRERQLSFDEVSKLEWSSAVILEDVRKDYGERRFRAYSTVIRPLIPRTFGHPVHGDPATDSMNIRPAIPR